MATASDLQSRLNQYLAAEQKILQGDQSWTSPDGMTYNRGNLYHLQREIRNLEAAIAIAKGTGYGAKQFVFWGRR